MAQRLGALLTAYYACRSIEIFTPLLTPDLLRHPAWASWCKLVELFSVVVQHKLTVQDVQVIDDLQLEYTRLFNLVPEYVGYRRPKHHFLSHLAVDVWRFGPPRGYWCFGFEAFNKVLKAGAKRSNYRATSLSVMRHWSVVSARNCVREARGM